MTDQEHEVVVAAGGLHIVGTERHDSRRIDNQLRGRAGRQGDPGSSRFYLSLEDDLMKRFASERVTGLMERLGLEDDVAIESRLVSRTIESAQSRVEGFNFDIRKRVVEFDDVINKQRETIYAERDKVLHNEDLTETVRAFIDEELDVLVDTELAGDDPHEWNLDGLSNQLHQMGCHGEGTTPDELWELASREAISEHVRDLADAALDARSAEVGEADWATVERLVLVRTINSLWVEHLTELDDMRRGIGLRGYAQQDPLNEFRREAFRLYEELRGLIRHGVASSIFRVTVTRQPPRGRSGHQRLARRWCRCAHRWQRPGGAEGRRRDRDRGGRAGGRARGAQHPRIARRRAGGRPRPRRRRVHRRSATRLHPDGRSDRPERPLLVRVGRQVQEVSRTLSRDVLRLAAVAATGVIVVTGFATWRIIDQGGRDDARPADAIVVMGAAQYDGRPSPVFQARLDHAIDLFHAGIAPYLVVTGGKQVGDRTTEGPRRPSLRDRPRRARGRDPRRGPGQDDTAVDPRRRRRARARPGWGPRCSSATASTCSGSCGWRSDAGIVGLGLADRHEPAGARCDGPRRRHRSTSSAHSPSTSSPGSRPDQLRRADRTDFPLGDRGLARYTHPSLPSRTARVPQQVYPSPSRAVLRTLEGVH